MSVDVRVIDKNNNVGVLVVNLGTPSEPTTGAVFRYLGQFLSDKRVIDLPSFAWKTLLYGVILPLRSPKVAKLYQEIWTEQGSPLRVYNQAIAKQLNQLYADEPRANIVVRSAMSYGEPSVNAAMAEFEQLGIKKIVVLPLYPQYSATTTAVVYDQIATILMKTRYIPEVRMVMDYCDNPQYIQALGDSVRASRAKNPESQLLVMSFHGMPQRYVDAGDPYQAQCIRTAEALAENLKLAPEQWTISYQSRFGKATWLSPYTNLVLADLPGKGIKNIDIICPAFSVDCLETLEEISEENRIVFQDSGGQNYHYIPALNDQPDHILALKQLVDRQLINLI